MKTGISGRAVCARTLRIALAFGAIALTRAAWAQDDNQHIYQTYADSVAAAQKREPLGERAFGEKIALFSGSTEFSVTDISLPGNNDLPVALGRRFVIQDRNQYQDRVWLSNLGGFDDWDVEVPYLEGTFPAQFGWIVAAPGDPGSLMRCSRASAPFVDVINVGFSLDKAWQGYHLHMPGADDESLLVATDSTFGAPADGNSYPWTTAGNVRLRCLGQTENGYPGEGFIAVTPDGKR